jgi:hypothetical protein
LFPAPALRAFLLSLAFPPSVDGLAHGLALVLRVAMDGPCLGVDDLPQTDFDEAGGEAEALRRRPRVAQVEGAEVFPEDHPVGGVHVRVSETADPQPRGLRTGASDLAVGGEGAVETHPHHGITDHAAQ